MARIARTGELTPPGITALARAKSAAERESFSAAPTVPTIFDVDALARRRRAARRVLALER
jgi:hypothetical protein